jgi:hypothetical protein
MFDRERNIAALLQLYVDESRRYWSGPGGQPEKSAARAPENAAMHMETEGHA